LRFERARLKPRKAQATDQGRKKSDHQIGKRKIEKVRIALGGKNRHPNVPEGKKGVPGKTCG